MATMNFSVPDDVKERFNRTFAGANKSATLDTFANATGGTSVTLVFDNDINLLQANRLFAVLENGTLLVVRIAPARRTGGSAVV